MMRQRLSNWLQAQAHKADRLPEPSMKPEVEFIPGTESYIIPAIYMMDISWAEELLHYLDDPKWEMAFTIGWGALRRKVAPGTTARVYMGWALFHPTKGIALRLQKQVVNPWHALVPSDPFHKLPPALNSFEKHYFTTQAELEKKLAYWGLNLGKKHKVRDIWQNWYDYRNRTAQFRYN